MDAVIIRRLRMVALGRTINGTYKQDPFKALDSFRKDLNLLLDEFEKKRG